MQDLLRALDGRAAALVLLVFSIPALIPTPGIPAGLLFGSLLTSIGLQMLWGVTPIRLPPGLSALRIDRAYLNRTIDRTLPHLVKCERWVRPRWHGLATPMMNRGIGLVVCIMGVLIALPIPFGNTLPGLAVLVLALGLGQQDGVAVLVGLSLAIVAIVVSWGLFLGSWWIVERYIVGLDFSRIL